ncbi:MAG: Energy-coupling factor transporter transmembrane protein EcfT [candidate division WS2 bacterium]|nr:Energy-coupling factor transporter transmembrane protein EcfT [Candidatus Lithacetigena glycinireducens]
MFQNYKSLIGYFLPLNTVIHNLNPQVKLICMILLMSGLLINYNLAIIIIYLFLLLVVYKTAKIPLSVLYNSFKPIIWIIFFSSLVHLFTTPGEPLLSRGFLNITVQGIQKSLILSSRIILIVGFTMLISLTTSPVNLVEAISSLLKPFSWLGLPVNQFSLMLSLSLRFLPVIYEEAERIKKAQLARGANFSSWRLKNRVNNVVSIVIPMIYSAIIRADDLAIAMEIRGYKVGGKRTRLKETRFLFIDLVILLLSLIIFIITFLL